MACIQEELQGDEWDLYHLSLGEDTFCESGDLFDLFLLHVVLS